MFWEYSLHDTYFYPRSPCGERHKQRNTTDTLLIFLSTLSLRRATLSCSYAPFELYLFLSTLSLRRATIQCVANGKWQNHFYPRSPCGERQNEWLGQFYEEVFLSTLSLRRATFFPLALPFKVCISIHALLAESDLCERQGRFGNSISIHALLAESDQESVTYKSDREDFYPRSPCGERHLTLDGAYALEQFLSTLSLRRATLSASVLSYSLIFLSTLSLRRATEVERILLN